MGEPAYNTAVMRPLARWFGLAGSHASFHLPLVGPEGGRVLFVQDGDLTDLLFASPLMSALHARYPNCRISALVREDASELIRHHPHVHDMLFYHPDRLKLTTPSFYRLARQLRQRAYDIVVHMGESPEPTHELLAYLCGAPVRVGPASERGYPYVNCELRWNSSRSGYEGRRLGQLAPLLGVQLPPEGRAAMLTEQDVRFAHQLVHFRKPRRDQLLVGVDPGKGKSNTRVTARTLQYLLGIVHQQYRSKVLVLATPDEEEVASRFEQELQCDRLDLPRHNVKDVVALLTQCDLFLAGNTNLFHFAVALGVPTIGLFTERDEARWVPPLQPHWALVQGRRGVKLSTADFLAQIEGLLSLPPRTEV